MCEYNLADADGVVHALYWRKVLRLPGDEVPTLRNVKCTIMLKGTLVVGPVTCLECLDLGSSFPSRR